MTDALSVTMKRIKYFISLDELMKPRPTKREIETIPEKIFKAWEPVLKKEETIWKEWYLKEGIPAINRIFNKDDNQES